MGLPCHLKISSCISLLDQFNLLLVHRVPESYPPFNPMPASTLYPNEFSNMQTRPYILLPLPASPLWYGTSLSLLLPSPVFHGPDTVTSFLFRLPTDTWTLSILESIADPQIWPKTKKLPFGDLSLPVASLSPAWFSFDLMPLLLPSPRV